MKKHIIVIGGGMAGTSAAYHLQKKGYEVTLLEKNDRLGGRIHSITTDDAIFEVGAGFITDIYTNVFAFLKEQKLDAYLQMRKSKSAIVKDNTLQWIFSGSVLFRNSLISSRAKRKLFKELVKLFSTWRFLDIHDFGKAYILDKKTLAQVFANSSGKELIDYLIQPALDGYFYWSAEKTSYAMLPLLFKAALMPHKTYILKCGLQRIAEKAAVGSRVLLNHEVVQVNKISNKVYEVIVQNNRASKKMRADGIVCATTATEVLEVIKNLSSQQRTFFSSVHYSSTAVVAKTYTPKVVPPNYAIAYPRKENTTVGAVTIVSDTGKYAKKITLVKIYATGESGKKLSDENDTSIDKVLSEGAKLTNSLFDNAVNPTFRYVKRWKEAIPEFDIGYFQRLHALKEKNITIENGAIVFAGDYLGGPFTEGAFTSGKEAAERLDQQLK